MIGSRPQCRWVAGPIGSTPPYLTFPAREFLEIGFGRGHLLHALARRGIWVTGIDSSPQMARLSMYQGKKEGVVPCLVNGYAQFLPFKSSFFSQVVATFPAEFIWEDQTLHEIHRVLQRDGLFILLPVAWITGKGLLDRGARSLFQITGQAPEMNDHSIETQTTSRLVRAGFSVDIEKIFLNSSLVLIVRSRKRD